MQKCSVADPNSIKADVTGKRNSFAYSLRMLFQLPRLFSVECGGKIVINESCIMCTETFSIESVL
jgi:hypothetical protein